VYEDDKYVAFLDINPINFGHTLVIPREHYPSLHETPDEVLAGMMKITKKIAPAIVKAMKADGYNVGVNTGMAAGQAVDHVHFHLIPRFADDGFRAWAGRNRYDEGEMGVTAKKIKENLEKS
jgi:histidine triad (HIT) family protein